MLQNCTLERANFFTFRNVLTKSLPKLPFRFPQILYFKIPLYELKYKCDAVGRALSIFLKGLSGLGSIYLKNSHFNFHLNSHFLLGRSGNSF